MESILIGYFPRRQPGPSSKLAALPNVKEIASLGHYTSDGPANWVDQWRHTELWFFDSEALARKVVADAIHIHIEPDPKHDPPWQIRLVAPVPADCERLGYDGPVPAIVTQARIAWWRSGAKRSRLGNPPGPAQPSSGRKTCWDGSSSTRWGTEESLTNQ